MSKKARIKRDFLQKNDTVVDSRSQFVIAGLTGNTHFPQPTPTVAELAAASKKFQDGMHAAQTRDHIKVLQKNDLRTVLQNMLNRLADYVTFVSNGDRAIMVGAGFLVNSESKTVNVLGPFIKFEIELGTTSGEAVVKLKAENADFYSIYFIEGAFTSATDLSGWKHMPSKLQQVSIYYLKPATLYSFFAKAHGSNGQEVESVIITKIVV